MSRQSLWAAAVATGALSCTLPNTAGDAGTVDAGAQMVGDQCNAIALAFCTRAIGGCGFPEALSDCIANQTPSCCLGSACNAVSQSSASALDACTSAIASEDCNSVVTVGVPGVAACQGIPQAP